MSAGMIEERRRGAECDLHLTTAGSTALEKLTEARRSGLTELLEGWNPEEHPEIIEMVKELAHSLLADDERLVADAMPQPAAAAGRGLSAGEVRRHQRGVSGSTVSASRREARADGGAPMASSPISAAPRTGGAPSRTRTAFGCRGMDPRGDPVVESRVGRAEHAPTEHDLDGRLLELEPRRRRRARRRPPRRPGCLPPRGRARRRRRRHRGGPGPARRGVRTGWRRCRCP